jgi:hypothetical protein
MKKCQACSYENADAMRFCVECGSLLPDLPSSASPTVAFSLHDSRQPQSNLETTSFDNPAVEHPSGNNPSFPSNFQSVPASPNRQSRNKVFLILGGAFALLLLIFAIGAIFAYYNWKTPVVANTTTTPSPRQFIDEKSPTPTPSVSPAVTPEASFTPPIEATKKGSFTIYANDEGWHLSDIDVVSLEQYRTNVQGLIDLAEIKTGVSSKGLTDTKTKSRRLYPEFPTGALLMRTRYAEGKFSNMQAVTAGAANGSWQNFPDELGKLEFCINDSEPADNGGQFTVTVTMTSVPKRKK